MIEQVVVNNTTYHIPQASAAKQFELVQLIGGRVAANMKFTDRPISIPLLKGCLVTIGMETLNKIKDIVMPSICESGKTEAITLDQFQGRIDTYYTLIAEAIRVNLQDFFTYLDNARSEENPVNPIPAR